MNTGRAIRIGPAGEASLSVSQPAEGNRAKRQSTGIECHDYDGGSRRSCARSR